MRTARVTGCAAVVALGALALFLMGLFPPWVEERWRMQNVLYWQSHSARLDRHFDGYHYVFSGRPAQDVTERPTYSGGTWERVEYHVYWSLLAVQGLALSVVVVAAIFWSALRKGRPRQPDTHPGPALDEGPRGAEGRGNSP